MYAIFFSQVHVPVRWINISVFPIVTLRCDSCCANQSSPEWITLLGNLCPLLKHIPSIISGYQKMGVGDLVIIGGWGVNYEETQELDFVDLSIRIGLLCPTSARTKAERVFDIPLGYKGNGCFQSV